MGRTSKFSFPIPGRKRSSSREQAYQVPPPPSKISSGNLSKAEQILGTGTIESGDWRRPGSRSSRMSISISESTHSTVQDGHDYDQWDGESGVFPRQTNLRGQASSNALGQRFGEDMATETSSTTHRLRNENSTSTLKSYYDRQKLPAAISQQTSASSARDMALRKGLTPVVSRSAHLQADSVDLWDQAGQSLSSMNDNHLGSPEQKKSVRAGISSLFHRSERRPSAASQNSYDSSKQNTSLRNRLAKAASKESLQSQRQNILSTKSRDQRDQIQNHANPDDSHDYYDQSARNAHMKAIPETNVPETFNLFPNTSENSNSRQPGSLNSEKREGRRRLEDLHSSSGEKEAFSWKNPQHQNIETNRGSVFSSADLQQSTPSHAESEIIPPALQNRLSTTKNPSRRSSALKNSSSTRKTSDQSNAFLTIPEPNGGLSKWPMPPSITRQDSMNSQDSRPTSSHKPKKHIQQHQQQQQQPTPPLSPKEIDAETDSIHTTSSGRMMQVTQQEEALLEALRQKRARMREKIIEEHQARGVSRSPPRSTGNRASSRFSKASTASTIRPGTEKVPLILDAPIMRGKDMGFGGRYGMGTEYGQPSPDLSDFLSMGSEEFEEDDETPTNSRGVSRNEVRGHGSASATAIDAPQFKRPGTPPQHDPRFASLEVEKGGRNEDHVKRNPSMGKVRFVG
ncbi:hypothetical protein H4I95_02073 [Botrytis cinerea]